VVDDDVTEDTGAAAFNKEPIDVHASSKSLCKEVTRVLEAAILRGQLQRFQASFLRASAYRTPCSAMCRRAASQTA